MTELSLRRSDTAYVRSLFPAEASRKTVEAVTPRKFVYVAPDIRRSGGLLRRARIINGILAVEIGDGLGITGEEDKAHFVADFEEGKIADPNLPLIIQSAEQQINPDDPHLKEMREIAYRVGEDKKWLWRLNYDKMTAGQAVLFMRLLTGDTQTAFAKNTFVSSSALRDIESGKREPRFSTLNQIMAQTEFDKRHRSVAQRIRLQAENTAPMSVDGFINAPLGVSAHYLRIQTGLSPKESGKAAGRKSQTLVTDIEADTDGTISELRLTGLLEGLGAPAELIRFMQQRAKGKRPFVTNELRAVFLDTYYFTDPYQNEAYPFSPEDEALSINLKKEQNFGAALTHARKEKGFSQEALGGDQANMSKYELNSKIPYDHSIVQFAAQLGFHPLDQTTDALLSHAAKERAKAVGIFARGE